jgi:hypothetical protein
MLDQRFDDGVQPGQAEVRKRLALPRSGRITSAPKEIFLKRSVDATDFRNENRSERSVGRPMRIDATRLAASSALPPVVVATRIRVARQPAARPYRHNCPGDGETSSDDQWV